MCGSFTILSCSVQNTEVCVLAAEYVRHTFRVVDVVWESFGVTLKWANVGQCGPIVLALVVDVCEEGRWVVPDCLGCFLLCVVILFQVVVLNGCFNSVELKGVKQYC